MFTFLPVKKPDWLYTYFYKNVAIVAGVLKTQGEGSEKLILCAHALENYVHTHGSISEEVLTEYIHKALLNNLPFFMLILIENKLLVATGHEFSVLLTRGGHRYTVAAPNQMAQGSVVQGDVFAIEAMGIEESIVELEVVPLGEEMADEAPVEDAPLEIAHPLAQPLSRGFSPSQKWYLILVAFAVLLMAVIYNHNLKQKAQVYLEKQQQIQTLLVKAQEAANVNTQQAQEFYNEAVALFNEAKPLALKSQEAQVKALEQMLADLKDTVANRKQTELLVFFDFALDKADFSVKHAFLQGVQLLALGTDGTLYTLNTATKSFTKTRVANASMAFALPKKTFALTDGGVIDTASGTVVIESVTAAQDVCVYNSNIYMVPPEKNDFIKYVPSEQGYAKGVSYFLASKPKTINSCFIDKEGSVYFATENGVAAFKQGKTLGLALGEPRLNSVTKVLKGENGDIAVWSKPEGRVLVYSAQGVYKKEILSPQLTTAGIAVMSGNTLLFLQGNKVYELEL